jgi:hypothetical protein
MVQDNPLGEGDSNRDLEAIVKGSTPDVTGIHYSVEEVS